MQILYFVLRRCFQNCNDACIDFSTFEVTNSKLHLIDVVTISPFDWCSSSIINAWLNKDDTRLCFSYNDSILFVYDFKLSITCSVKTPFVSILCFNRLTYNYSFTIFVLYTYLLTCLNLFSPLSIWIGILMVM